MKQVVKCVLVGDGGVGKTCLAISYTCGQFPTEYIPTVFDNYSPTFPSYPYLNIWDTAGQSDYDRLRPLSYPNTDIVLICMSVGVKQSLKNVISKWQVEVKHYIPQVKIILVGTKIDLREDKEYVEQANIEGKELIYYEEGEAIAKQIGALCYLECSSAILLGVNEVFQKALHYGGEEKEVLKRKGCLIL